MKNFRWTSFAAVALLLPSIASAAEPQATTTSQEEQSAQQLSDQAYEAYERADYAKAIASYLASYKLIPTADILYNVANIYDKKLGDASLAIEFYRRHNAAPDAKPDLVGKATARIASLSAGGSNASSDSRAGAPSGDDTGKALRVTGIVTGVVGVIGIGIGSVTGLMASGKHDDSACSNGTCPTAVAAEEEKDAATLANVSTGAFITGGVLLATGVALYLFAPKRGSSRRGTSGLLFAPLPSNHGAFGSLVGRF